MFDSVVLLKCTGHLFDLPFSCGLVHGLDLAYFDKHDLLRKYQAPIAQPAGNLDAIKAPRTRNWMNSIARGVESNEFQSHTSHSLGFMVAEAFTRRLVSNRSP